MDQQVKDRLERIEEKLDALIYAGMAGLPVPTAYEALKAVS